MSAAFLVAATFAAEAAADWRELPEGGRWAPLSVSAGTRVGFTQLQPESTGLWFTNTLDAASSAANRVLENGSGVALGDYDRDGLVDVFLCGLERRSQLFRNLGDWKFADGGAAAGLDFEGLVCRGAVFADLDGDQWPDLLVSTLDRGVLCFRNNGRGGFDDRTRASGLEPTRGATTMTLADVDGNGTLDLYVAHYRAEDIRDQARVEVRYVNGKPVLPPHYQDRLVITPGGLLEFGEPDRLYLNDGRGVFHVGRVDRRQVPGRVGASAPRPAPGLGINGEFPGFEWRRRSRSLRVQRLLDTGPGLDQPRQRRVPVAATPRPPAYE